MDVLKAHGKLLAVMLPQCLSYVFLSGSECLQLRPSLCTGCVRGGKSVRKEGRELSGALAKHLIGSYTELTFEGCRGIYLEMKGETNLEKESKKLSTQQAFCRIYQWFCLHFSSARPHILCNLHPP